MELTVFGSGYVGLITAACMAEMGNHVVYVDTDEDKINRLNAGEMPIYEPGLEDYIRRNIAAERLDFTTDEARGVAHGLFQFIAVGTPSDEDGSVNLKYVLAVAESIGTHMNKYRVIVDKSTVPVGTTEKVGCTIQKALERRSVTHQFDVVSNPEFLKEGAAIADFMEPERIIIGTNNSRTTKLLRTLYGPFNRNCDRLISMDIRSAELTKYAANAMLATKISFMNELANIAERCGADIEMVRMGIGSDSRIGSQFIYPGAGYGGSCLPKDVRALVKAASAIGYEADLLKSVEAVNQRQKYRLFENICKYFDDDMNGKIIAIWGLSFKPETDDMREASSRVLMEALWTAGAKVRAYDPEALEATRRLYPDNDALVLCETANDAVSGADVLAIVTEWQEFRNPDFAHIKQKMKYPVIFDGRNLYDPTMVEALGLTYYGIGRGQSVPAITDTRYGRRSN